VEHIDDLIQDLDYTLNQLPKEESLR
jgi:cystathionine gamma-synthase